MDTELLESVLAEVSVQKAHLELCQLRMGRVGVTKWDHPISAAVRHVTLAMECVNSLLTVEPIEESE